MGMNESTKTLPKIIATSVVRGSQQGESHGGVYLIDFEHQDARIMVDWNDSDIDFTGRGWDRGLRGIEFSGDEIFIAASDELFVYDQAFSIKRSYKNPFLKHAHEIYKFENLLFITSTGFDSLLVFDLERDEFTRGIHLRQTPKGWKTQLFDPKTEDYMDSDLNAREYCSLPEGTHNARVFKQGVLFNDTKSDCLRSVKRDGTEVNFKIPTYPEKELTHTDMDDSRIARQGFARGLCVVDKDLVAVGSSPSTISVFDLENKKRVATVNLSMDIRNAIHGLEVWPYERLLDS